MKKKEIIFIPGSIVRMKEDGYLKVLKAGTYQMIFDVYYNGGVRIYSGKGTAYKVAGNIIEVIRLPGKSTLKEFIRYLILYWLSKNVMPKENREFNGIELAKFVKAKVDKSEMYNPTVFKYMNELVHENLIGVFCKCRQKSLYFCQWVDLEALKNFYKETE